MGMKFGLTPMVHNSKLDSHMRSPLITPRTLVELLERRAAEQPDNVAFRLLAAGETITDSLTHARLDLRARAVGWELSCLAGPGERAIILCPSGLDFVTVFFGCLYAGLIAVPAYPLDSTRLRRTTARLETIIDDAGPVVALADRVSLEQINRLAEDHPALARVRWVAIESISDESAGKWRRPDQDPDAVAVIQYTSGSTKNPRGVMLTHRNVIENQDVFRSTFGYSHETTFVGWVPLAHDLGLFSHVVLPLYSGALSVLMTPEAFIQSPSRWMKAVGSYSNAATHAPNFAYELSAKRFTPEELASLDLSGLHTADLGGEPVRTETLESFERIFGPCGFRRESFVAAYGLAEATLLVSSARNPRVMRVSPAELQRGRVILETRDGAPVRSLVSVGRPTPGQKIAIVDPERATGCPPGKVGEIWVSGPNIGAGYWRKPEDTAQTFRAFIKDTQEGPFLRTGDLGFLDEGELFVTGRLKDVIILHGRNHYPQDFEFTAERCDPAFRPGCAAAFSVETGTAEELVVVQELRDRNQTGLDALIRKIRRALFEEHGIKAHAIILVPGGSVPKTSSGKIQRQACRTAYLSGDLNVIHAGVDQRRQNKPVPPGTPHEKMLAGIWSQALNVEAESIGSDDSFFDLGGDSLAAIGCVAHIRATFHLEDFSPEMFLYAPTLAQMARELTRNPQDRRTEIIPIQPRGNGMPLVIVTPGMECRSIARHLGPDHPVLGVRGADLGRQTPAPSLKEIAVEYADALLQSVPHGPYALCGWCGAGVVALEMARELEQRGENVAFVAIFDGRGIYYPPMPKSRGAFIRAWRFWQNSYFVTRRLFRDGVPILRRAMKTRRKQMAHAILRVLRALPPDHADVFTQCLLTWSPVPWSGRVLHLWAMDRPQGRYRDLDFEWGALTPNNAFFEVPGDHLSILHEPRVSAVARIIEGELDRADKFHGALTGIL